MKGNCGDCENFVTDASNLDLGECHYNPAVVIAAFPDGKGSLTRIGGWPPVQRKSPGCRVFEKKPVDLAGLPTPSKLVS